MLLSKLLKGCALKIGAPADKDITKVVTDSRKATPGCMFIALRGERSDGGEYIKEALARGAGAIVSDGDVQCDGVIPVEDARLAEAQIFSNLYSAPADGLRIAAVTGTNGKTSTVSCLSRILRSSGAKVGVIGGVELSVNEEELDRDGTLSPETSSMTTPVAEELYRTLALMRDRGCDMVVMEASSHALSLKRLSPLKIEVGAFTNLSPEHLDHHGTMEKYFEAKRSLSDISGKFVVNCDDRYGIRLFCSCKNPYGISVGADEAKRAAMFAVAENVSLCGGSVSYDCRLDGNRFHIDSPACGVFAVYNTLTAAAMAYLMGTDCGTIADAIRSFRGAPGRMETVFSEDGVPTAVIDYAHTPDALEKALKSVKADCGRLILVFGCGGDRDPSKRAPMGEIACRIADYSIVTGDNPRGEDPDRIIKDIVSGFYRNNYEVVPDRRDALMRAVDMSFANDTLICCGKGHEKYIIDKCGKHSFDEKKILVEALEKKYGTVSGNES